MRNGLRFLLFGFLLGGAVGYLWAELRRVKAELAWANDPESLAERQRQESDPKYRLYKSIEDALNG